MVLMVLETMGCVEEHTGKCYFKLQQDIALITTGHSTKLRYSNLKVPIWKAILILAEVVLLGKQKNSHRMWS